MLIVVGNPIHIVLQTKKMKMIQLTSGAMALHTKKGFQMRVMRNTQHQDNQGATSKLHLHSEAIYLLRMK